MLAERTFDTGTVRINYVAHQGAEAPGDGPLLLLLHGVTSRWQAWLNVMPALAQRWRVVAVDLRGHGASGHVANGYGLMAYAEDVIGLIRHLGGPAVLVGHSLGSMISIGVASETPDLVRAVVLEDPPLGAFDGRPFGVRPEYPRFVATRDLAREGLPLPELTKRLAALAPNADPVATRARAASVARVDPDVLTFIFENRSVENYDLGDRLRRIACPTLLLQGNPALDGAVSDLEVRWAASLIPDCTPAYLPHVGHGIHAADGPGFIQLVTGFLETV